MLLPKTYLVRMKEQERYRWWKPIVCFLLAGLLFVVFMAIAMFALGTSGVLSPFEVLIQDADSITTDELMEEAMNLMTGSGLGIAPLLGSIILLLPALWIAMKATRLGGFRTLSSVEGHLRWKRIGRLILPVLLVFALGNAAELAIASVLSSEIPAFSLPSLSYLLTILILVPVQSATEEYAFRGFLMQTFGSWIPIAVIPLVLQTVIFMGSHTYNIWGLLSILVFGLIAGVLALKTGGLEASIVFHATNNICAFLISAAVGANAMVAEATILDMAISIALDLAVFLVILHVAKKQGWLVDGTEEEHVPSAPRHMKS
jgi:membrane protease YdiL (CAAX protease family)